MINYNIEVILSSGIQYTSIEEIVSEFGLDKIKDDIKLGSLELEIEFNKIVIISPELMNSSIVTINYNRVDEET